MPQQTKTEALEELARLIRRDIMNGTARLNETWWFDDDTRMQDRIAHVLLDYSDDDDVLKGYAERCVLLREQNQASEDIAAAIIDDLNKQIDALNEKCAALVVERDQLEQARTDLLDEVGKRAGVIVALENELRESRRAFATAFGEQRERAFDKMAKPLVAPAKVGDRVKVKDRVVGGANEGRIGVLIKVCGSFGFVDQGVMMFEAQLSDLEVLS